MDVFGVRSVGFLEIDFLEIVDFYLDVSADQLDVYDDFLVLGASQGIAVFFVGREGVRKGLVLGELNLCILGLSVDLGLDRLKGSYFQQKSALIA